MNVTQLGMVAAGGALGAVCRFLMYVWVNPLTTGFPLGQALANIIGSFAAGMCLAYAASWTTEFKSFLIIGFLGSFTTMSAYAVDATRYMENKQPVMAFLMWSVGSILCLWAAYGGIIVSKKVF